MRGDVPSSDLVNTFQLRLGAPFLPVAAKSAAEIGLGVLVAIALLARAL